MSNDVEDFVLVDFGVVLQQLSRNKREHKTSQATKSKIMIDTHKQIVNMTLR